MVYFNDEMIVGGIFPNNERYYRPIHVDNLRWWDEDTPPQNTVQDIRVIFEDNNDLFDALLYKKYLDDKGYWNVRLVIDFLTYGQADRPFDNKIFTFKYIAQLINDANFDEVIFYDPHSRVMEAAIDRARIIYPKIFGDYDLYFYPDNGAASKYSEVYPKMKYRFGNKKRNLDTGAIIKYEVVADREDIEGKKILVRDDICMGGRTFQEAAKALNNLGAAQVDLYITHLMPQARDFYEGHKEYGIANFYTANTLQQHWVKASDMIR